MFQGSNLIRHRESLHAYYTCAYCHPQLEIILGKKQLSDHLKRVHKLKINLRTYFEDEKRIFGALKRGTGVPKLQCSHCGFVTDNVTVWTKHDCNVVKIEKPPTSLFSPRCSSDQISVGSSSIDPDGASDRSSSPTDDDCFSPPPEPNDNNNGDDDDDSRSEFESCSDTNGRNSASAVDTESGFGDEASQSQVSVPDFSAVNEFFEFRLYDSVSASNMNRIWDEAIASVFRKSTSVGLCNNNNINNNNTGRLVLARPVHDELAVWDM